MQKLPLADEYIDFRVITIEKHKELEAMAESARKQEEVKVKDDVSESNE